VELWHCATCSVTGGGGGGQYEDPYGHICIRCDHLGLSSWTRTFQKQNLCPAYLAWGCLYQRFTPKNVRFCSQKNAKLIDRLVLTSEICSFLQILRVHHGPVSMQEDRRCMYISTSISISIYLSIYIYINIYIYIFFYISIYIYKVYAYMNYTHTHTHTQHTHTHTTHTHTHTHTKHTHTHTRRVYAAD
jgi:hypothetical protein